MSCKKPPEYPKTPEISFLNISKKAVYKYVGPSSPRVLTDSVTISLYFKDGNGDIGRNDDTDNFFCKVFLKKNGRFYDLIDSTDKTKPATIVDKNGRFFSLNPDGRQGPIEGILNYGPRLNLTLLVDSTYYILKFQVHIKDNNGNASNVVETPEIGVRLY